MGKIHGLLYVRVCVALCDLSHMQLYVTTTIIKNPLHHHYKTSSCYSLQPHLCPSNRQLLVPTNLISMSILYYFKNVTYVSHTVCLLLRWAFTLTTLPLQLIQELVSIVYSFLVLSCIPTISIQFYLKYHHMLHWFMLWEELHPSSDSYVEVPQNVTVLGDRAFKQVIKVK